MQSFVMAIANWLGGSALLHFRLRTLLYRAVGMKVNLRGRIWPGCRFATNRVSLGWRTTVNAGCLFDNGAPVTVGHRVGIGPRVNFITSTHDYTNPSCRAGVTDYRPITVGNGVWIGAGATILGGVTIGDGAIVAAGAVVTRDCPPHTVSAGIPARVIRVLSTSDHQGRADDLTSRP